MRLKIAKKLAIIGLTLVALTGCSNGAMNQIDELHNKLTKLEEENKNLETSMSELEKQVDTLTSENNSLLLEIESLTKIEYPIYTRDVQSWEIVEVQKVKIDKNLSLQEKITTLAKELSASQFDNYPIKVIEIKKVNGEQIAVIDLKDKDTNEQTWMNSYFQGSAGGEITKTALEETLLQKDNEEKWIDGIQIFYNGERWMSDHMTLGNIVYRDR